MNQTLSTWPSTALDALMRRVLAELAPPVETSVAPGGLDALSTSNEAMGAVVRLAAGDETEIDRQMFRDAVRSWFRSGCSRPIEVFLKLPTTPKAYERMQRDLALHDAARRLRVEGMSSWRLAGEVAAELNRFLSPPGNWPAWRDMALAPDYASPPKKALFMVAKFNAGKSLSQQQIYNLLQKK